MVDRFCYLGDMLSVNDSADVRVAVTDRIQDTSSWNNSKWSPLILKVMVYNAV